MFIPPTLRLTVSSSLTSVPTRAAVIANCLEAPGHYMQSYSARQIFTQRWLRQSNIYVNRCDSGWTQGTAGQITSETKWQTDRRVCC
jgi:hypothetical protein